MNLNFHCPINRTAYGYHSSYTLKYLDKLGWDVAHLPIGQSNPDPSFKFAQKPFHHNAPCLKLWHQFDMSGFTGSPKIGFSAFELEDLNPNEIHNMAYPDLMLVPSVWAQQVCAKSGVKVDVVPEGYDDEVFLPTPIEERENTVFANFGKWEIRKGHDVLIKAFNAAFDKDDEVVLVMMPTNQFLKPEQSRVWEKMYLESKLGDKIQIIPRASTHLDVYNVMKQTDCGVFPARAEGWNLEALEMMGCGKEVIITGCTGHLEFIDRSCKIIDMPEQFETAYDGIFFNGFSKWRKITKDSFDQLVAYLREVHQNRLSQKVNIEAVNRAKEFSWEVSTNVLAKKISNFIT